MIQLTKKFNGDIPLRLVSAVSIRDSLFSAGRFCLAVSCAVPLSLHSEPYLTGPRTATSIERELRSPCSAFTSCSSRNRPRLAKQRNPKDPPKTVRLSIGWSVEGRRSWSPSEQLPARRREIKIF